MTEANCKSCRGIGLIFSNREKGEEVEDGELNDQGFAEAIARYNAQESAWQKCGGKSFACRSGPRWIEASSVRALARRPWVSVKVQAKGFWWSGDTLGGAIREAMLPKSLAFAVTRTT